ncbi:hypothetical protein ACWOFR_08650 [Carnobacterium gallinarum]|uniref:hypothetical protein n=1 Tax=Carnobacterium gallinarum TaxID=2749 RepID=UPI0005560B99|nr:hypothetical protein [Carnobacterium gallinarum]
MDNVKEKTIYQATFEESEQLVQEKNIKRAIKESDPHTVTKRFFGVHIAFLLLYIMYIFLKFIENGAPVAINILSLRIPYFWLVITLIIMLIHEYIILKNKNKKNISLSYYYNLTMLIYSFVFILFIFLFLLSLVNLALNSFWIIMLYAILFVIFITTQNNLMNNSIKENLYGTGKKITSILGIFEKYQKSFGLIGGIIIIGKTIQSFFVKNQISGQNDFITKLLEVFSPMLAFVMVLIPIYMKSEILIGYYLSKYSEEYRLKYGYSNLEWYGKKSKQYKNELKTQVQKNI